MKRLILRTPLLVMLLSTPPLLAAQGESATAQDTTKRTAATAQIGAIGGSKVSGRITFQHAGSFIFIEGRVEGLSPGKHGLHVHAGTSCSDRGGHFDPGGHPHGSPDQPVGLRHVGDLGNLVAGTDGVARFARVDALARLQGPHSVVDRVIVVHSGEDDYISQPSGDSGEQIGCGVIRRTPAESMAP